MSHTAPVNALPPRVDATQNAEHADKGAGTAAQHAIRHAYTADKAAEYITLADVIIDRSTPVAISHTI